MIAELISDALAESANAAALQSVLEREAGVPPEETRELAELLERYLGGLPSALGALTAMTKEPGIGRSIAFAAGQVLVYLVDEDDLFSESELGAVGLLDDAYLVYGCIAALRSAFPQLGAPASYEPPDERTIAAVRSLLPAGVADALDRTCENLVGVAAALFSGNGRQSPASPASRPPLRVDDAVRALS